MNKKYINVAIVLLSVALLAVVLFGYFGHKNSSENAKPTKSSNAKQPENSGEIYPSSIVDSILARTHKLNDISDPNKTLKDESKINISPNGLVKKKLGISTEDSILTSSRNQQDSALVESSRCLFEENEEFEVSSQIQNDLEKEIQAKKNAQSEVENENFEASESEITGQGTTKLELQPADALENTVTLENDVETESEVSSPFDVLDSVDCNPPKYHFPAERFELPCGYFTSLRGNGEILSGIYIIFHNMGSIEMPDDSLEKFDIMNFLCSDIPLKEYVPKDFLYIPSGIYETIGGEYEFEDGSTFLIPKGVKIRIPEKTIIEYPRGLDVQSMINLAFDRIEIENDIPENISLIAAEEPTNEI